MPDTLPENSEEPDELPVNERSSAFIDSAAFLNFVRLKSQVAAQQGGPEKSAVPRVTGCTARDAPLTDQDKIAAVIPARTQMNGEIEIEVEDWDSLFGAVEERLRGTVETLDSATPQPASSEKLSRIKSVVLDCVNSLDALHKALRHDRERHETSSTFRNSASIRLASRPTGRIDPTRKN